MENLPSNNINAPAKQERKKIEPVVVNEVTLRKKSLGARFRENFGGGDAKTSARFVALEVLLPGAKQVLSEGAKTLIDQAFFGNSGAPRPNTPYGYRPVAGPSPMAQFAYNQVSNVVQQAVQQRPQQRQAAGFRQTPAAPVDFREVIVATRPEADGILGAMQQIINEYGAVRVSELYALVGVTGEFTDEKYGWTDISMARPVMARGGGYGLGLPSALPLD